MNERRKNRSSFKDEALGLWLEALVRRSGCGAMALSDQSGLPIAGTDPARLEEISGVAASFAVPGQETIVSFEDSPLVIRTAEFNHERIVVAAMGRVDSCRQALEEAGWGVIRIMA